MSNLLNAIFENEILKEEIKTLLVKHGMYKEAQELMGTNKTINIDPELVIRTRPTMIEQNGTGFIQGRIIEKNKWKQFPTQN